MVIKNVNIRDTTALEGKAFQLNLKRIRFTFLVYIMLRVTFLVLQFDSTLTDVCNGVEKTKTQNLEAVCSLITLMCYFVQFIYACVTEPYSVTESHLLVVFTPSFLCTIERHYKYTLFRLTGHLWASACGFAAFILLGLFTQTTGHIVQFCCYVLSNTMTSLFSQFSVRVCS